MILQMAILMAKVCCLDHLDLHIVKDCVETDKRITANLTWSPSEDAEYYIVYRRRPDLSNKFQTISTFNFDDSERIRVLNAYPSEHSGCPSPGRGTWKVSKADFIFANGTSASVSQSSSLKVWIEGGSLNGIQFENLGKSAISNEQLITVDIIEVEELKKHRSLIWNYDIVAFGSWDGNGAVEDYLDSLICNFPDKALTDEIQKYLDCKFSVIASHDTISRITGTIHGLGPIRERFGLRVGGRLSRANEVDVDVNNVPMVQVWSLGTNMAVVAKKGQIVSYPWNISGDSFGIYWSHTFSSLVQHGDVWVTLNLSVPQEILAQDPGYIEGNFDVPFVYGAWEGSHLDSYLSTLNNTAVIQTGHYNCLATIDERKLWANLIYYMKQRTNKTKVVDRSIVDEEAPPIPQCECYGNDDWMFDIKCTAVDSNISFEYLVHGFSNGNTLIASSSEVQFNATSEISHFIYLFDDLETISDDYLASHGTIHDGDTFNKIYHPVTGKKSFMHIAVVDKSGNTSPLSDYYLPSKCSHITQIFTHAHISNIYTQKLISCIIYSCLFVLPTY